MLKSHYIGVFTMLSNDYELYVNRNIDLVRSMVIKSSQINEAWSNHLLSWGLSAEQFSPAQTKYYRNLRGLYWQIEDTFPTIDQRYRDGLSDQLMYFTSIDTDDTTPLLLSISNLASNPLSLSELRKFDRYYRDLVLRYPDQEELIRRIIDPINDVLLLPYPYNFLYSIQNLRGGWDASQNNYPTTGGSGINDTIVTGDGWDIIMDGKLGGHDALVGMSIRAKVDNPGQNSANWSILATPVQNLLNALMAITDGTILFYRKDLVDPNEHTLISQLQTQLITYWNRWNIPAYGVSDNLYPAAFLAITALNMVQMIMDLRMERIRSNEVCQFHLWSYLAGFYRLDRFKDAMTLEQSLWLYKNIQSIVDQAGSKDTLLFIYNGFIKPSGMSLATFELRQDYAPLEDQYKNGVVLTKFDIAAQTLQEREGSRASLNDLYFKMRRSAKDNDKNIDQRINDVKLKMRNSQYSHIATGVVECNVDVIPNDGIVSKIEERLNQWFYLAFSKFGGASRFKYSLSIPDVRDGSLHVSALEAAKIVIFISQRMGGLNPLADTAMHYHDPSTPSSYQKNNRIFIARDILFQPESSPGVPLVKADLNPFKTTSLTYNQTFPVEMYNQLVRGITLSFPTANNYVPLPSLNDIVVRSIAEFNEYTDAIAVRKLVHKLMVDTKSDYLDRASIRSIVETYYRTFDCQADLPSNPVVTWSELFTAIQMDLSTLTNEELLQIGQFISEHFIGKFHTQEGMSTPYYELMLIMRILCSYTLTFIPGNGNVQTKPLDGGFIYPRLRSVTVTYGEDLETVFSHCALLGSFTNNSGTHDINEGSDNPYPGLFYYDDSFNFSLTNPVN